MFEGVFPSSQRRGGRASLIDGAPGAKREPDRAKPQLMVSSAKFSPVFYRGFALSGSRFAPPRLRLRVAQLLLRLRPIGLALRALLCEEGNTRSNTYFFCYCFCSFHLPPLSPKAFANIRDPVKLPIQRACATD